MEHGTIQKRDFFDDCSTAFRLNLHLTTTPRSLVNWLSGIPPAPTIHYAKKHLDGSEEGYSYLVADTYIAGASFSFSLSVSFAAQAIST